MNMFETYGPEYIEHIKTINGYLEDTGIKKMNYHD